MARTTTLSVSPGQNVEGALASGHGDRNNTDQRKALVLCHLWIGYHHARPQALLLVAEGRIERHQYDGSATESQARRATPRHRAWRRPRSRTLLLDPALSRDPANGLALRQVNQVPVSVR